jgi:hypothetical protein
MSFICIFIKYEKKEKNNCKIKYKNKVRQVFEKKSYLKKAHDLELDLNNKRGLTGLTKKYFDIVYFSYLL